MNRAFLAFVKSCMLVALLTVSAAVIGTDEKKVPVVRKADVAKGESLYTTGDHARNIPACVSCHGVAGNSTIAQNPKLSAQHETYTFKQLVNFKGVDRSNPVMSPIAKALGDDEMRDIAAYLDKQSAKSGAAKNKDTVDLGKKIYRAGIVEKNVPACAGCHSPNGAGIPAQFARLAGQHQDYTAKQLTDFRAGARKNSVQMVTIAKRLSDDEIKAVADYIAGLK